MSSDPRTAPEYALPDEPVRDGIAEDDNPIPLWFNVGFYGLMLFGVAYIVYYLASGWSAALQYADEVETAEARYAAVRAALPKENPYRGDAQAIAEGQEVFDTICAACHLPNGQGLVGPSLVDPYWKYGSDDESLFTTVSEGRPLGMPPWGSQLGAERIWKALAYAETLPKSDAPGVGAPDYVPPTAPGS
jgi:cytochrome c oxidase cbb3-type subunit 3